MSFGSKLSPHPTIPHSILVAQAKKELEVINDSIERAKAVQQQEEERKNKAQLGAVNLDSLAKEIAEKQSIVEDLIHMSARHADIKKQVEQHLQTVEDHKQTIIKQKNKVEVLNREIASHESVKERKVEEIKALENTKIVHQTSIDQLVEQKTKAEHEKVLAESYISDLQGQVETLDKEISVLKGKKHLAQNELTEFGITIKEEQLRQQKVVDGIIEKGKKTQREMDITIAQKELSWKQREANLDEREGQVSRNNEIVEKKREALRLNKKELEEFYNRTIKMNI